MRLSIFDFDGTLFASPLQPSWWPFQGFWGRLESLSPPHVPERPGADWWSSIVVAAAKKAISDPNTFTILLTGRPSKLSIRVKELLGQVGLRFNDYYFSSGNTLSMKLSVIEKLVKQLNPEMVEMWEDRTEHIGDFERKLTELGTNFKVHKMPRITHEFENPPTTALRVAARFLLADAIGDPKQLILKFESAIDKLAILEKDLPWMWEAQKLWDEEGKLWGYNDYERMKTDPRLKQIKDYRSYQWDYVLKVKYLPHEMQVAQAGYLFLAILQQYDLPPKIRKSIEAAAKFHARSRARSPKREEALAAYEKMMEVLRSQLAAAKAAIAGGKPRSSAEPGAAQETTKAGPFNIINTGGFDEKTVMEAQEVVTFAAKQLQAKGITRILYGDVLISRTLSRQNVLAFYLVEKDELFIRANLRGKKHDAVRTVLHELGHRLHFKFLKDKDRDIRSIYAQIARKASGQKIERVREVLKDHPVLPGDKYVEKGKKGKVWEVTGTGYGRGGIVVQLVHKLEDPETGKSLALKAHIPLEGYLVNKGLLTNLDLSGFITGYASKNHEENFAEMISFYCLGKLPDDQVEMLTSVL